MLSRRKVLAAGVAGLAGVAAATRAKAGGAAAEVKKFARFQMGSTVAYGQVEGDKIVRIDGDLFGKWTLTAESHPLSEVKILAPTAPTQVYALAGNYHSHIKNSKIQPKFRIPQVFFKTASCIIANGEEIVIPTDAELLAHRKEIAAPNDPVLSKAEGTHYEAELVLVIGKKCSKVTPEQAKEYIFGVTCGNDVSQRDWQHTDVQWWRAKGADTFGPCGPYIVTGLNYEDLQMELRLNGEVKQKERTSLLIHNCAKQVSAISQWSTLLPGDLIFTGTPGTTSAMKNGDVCEVEIEGIGILKNTVRTRA